MDGLIANHSYTSLSTLMILIVTAKTTTGKSH